MANVTTIEIRAQDKTTTAFRKVNSGLTKLDQKLNNTKGNMGLLNGGLSKMAGLMGGLVGVAAITGFAKNLLTTADRLQKVGLQLGISVEKLQAYQFAASQSGINTEAMNSALKKFNINIGKAGQGAGEQVKGFENLGIAIYDTNGNLRDSPAIFEDVADKITLMESPAEKAEAAVALFGKAGVDLLPLLNQGAEGVRGFEKTLVDAGAVIGQDAADDISTFNDKIDLLSRTFQANLAPALIAILPALTLLAENFDSIAIFVGIAAAAFLAAKIPILIGAITTGITALTVAIALNPIGAIAVAITALGTAAYTYGDEILDFFGFAEDAPEDLKKTNIQLDKTEGILKDLAKVEVKRTKIAEKFVKTSKKDIIPNLKKLEEGLGKTKIEFVNLTGQEGLGGIQLAFRTFFMDVWSDAMFYLGGTSATIKKNFTNMKTDFEEFFKALDNIVIFEGQDVKNAFSSLMTNLETQVKDLEISINTVSIKVPDTIFDFTNTVVSVPGAIFGTAATAEAKLVSLVDKINSYSASSKTVTRTAVSASRGGLYGGKSTIGIKPFWKGETPGNYGLWSENDLKYNVPSISTGGGGQTAPSQMSSPASRNASKGGGDNGVVVNIYDGTGQKISAYDSEIRVQITERASRNSQFAALE